jgi:hypothetical protein
MLAMMLAIAQDLDTTIIITAGSLSVSLGMMMSADLGANTGRGDTRRNSLFQAVLGR